MLLTKSADGGNGGGGFSTSIGQAAPPSSILTLNHEDAEVTPSGAEDDEEDDDKLLSLTFLFLLVSLSFLAMLKLRGEEGLSVREKREGGGGFIGFGLLPIIYI